MPSTLALILHTRAWRETSLLVDAFTQSQGRIALIAKGAKRPHSALRGLLEPFHPVHIQYTLNNSLKNLTTARWTQGLLPMPADQSMAAWYLSELCLRGLAEDDPHPDIFIAYGHAIEQLKTLPEGADSHSVLRQFEWRFLQAQGLWPDLPMALKPNWYYALNEEGTWCLADAHNDSWCVSGAVLNNLISGQSIVDQHDKISLRCALRAMLNRALPSKPFNTRGVWLELEQLKSL